MIRNKMDVVEIEEKDFDGKKLGDVLAISFKEFATAELVIYKGEVLKNRFGVVKEKP